MSCIGRLHGETISPLERGSELWCPLTLRSERSGTRGKFLARWFCPLKLVAAGNLPLVGRRGMALRKATVVIGANFGDCGKGLITDYLCSRPKVTDALVVRFCGGAQAGHTVVLPDGKRHVFHHYGSGTFAGARTYLSRFFVCNPVLFNRELQDLISTSFSLKVYAHRECLVTTPFDMVINQMLESSRGERRHGSCGVGVNETICRSQHPRYSLLLNDLQEPDKLMVRLIAIRDEYVPRRVAELGLMPDADLTRIKELDAVERFAKECRIFSSMVEPVDDGIIRKFEPVIFEGSQGLLLDQGHHWFPHVTRSNTGIQNVASIAKKAGLANFDVIYVTRAYMTRHGAGPFPTEGPLDEYFPEMFDETNIDHPFQGKLRYGLLTLDLLRSSITADLRKAKEITVNPSLAVTCLDQIGRRAVYIRDGQPKATGVDEFLSIAAKHTGFPVRLTSRGKTRADVRP